MDDGRLTETSDLPLEREVLRAAAGEAAPPAARRRVLATLGLLVIAPPAGVPSKAAGAGHSASSAVAKWLASQPWLPKLGLVLSIGGAAVGGGVIGGTVVLQRMSRPVETHEVAPTATAVEPTSASDVPWAINLPALAIQDPRKPTMGFERTPRARAHVHAGSERVRKTPVSTRATETSTVPSDAVTAAAPAAVAAPPVAAPPIAAPPIAAPPIAAPPIAASEALPMGSDATQTRSRSEQLKRSELTASVSIRDEIDLLDRARAAVVRGAPDAALAILDEYSARHPRGELREEAAVLTIDAMRARGNERAARAAARRFGQRFPMSAHKDGLVGGGSR